uniref:Chromosome 18 open reading frame 21 n=1 Tax=Falco tinnunculus TaxID=100819 RepID=A0A8C4UUJ9_FALTI
MGWQRRFLEAAAEGLLGACPGQARFLLFTRIWICPYCFQFLVPDSCRVRLKPKMKVTPQIEKILKQEAKNHKLSMKQTKLLKKYRESRSVLVRMFAWNCQIPDNSLKPFSGIKKGTEIFLLEEELTPTPGRLCRCLKILLKIK